MIYVNIYVLYSYFNGCTEALIIYSSSGDTPFDVFIACCDVLSKSYLFVLFVCVLVDLNPGLLAGPHIVGWPYCSERV